MSLQDGEMPENEIYECLVGFDDKYEYKPRDHHLYGLERTNRYSVDHGTCRGKSLSCAVRRYFGKKGSYPTTLAVVGRVGILERANNTQVMSEMLAYPWTIMVLFPPLPMRGPNRKCSQIQIVLSIEQSRSNVLQRAPFERICVIDSLIVKKYRTIKQKPLERIYGILVSMYIVDRLD